MIKDFLEDGKGQSEVIGFILVLAILATSLSVVQANMVPNWNQEVEFEHLMDVTDDMKSLLSSIEKASSHGEKTTSDIKLGTDYPNRMIFANPPPSQGEIKTYDLTFNVSNAVAKSSDVACLWDGSEISYDTKGLVYTPNYYYLDGTSPLLIEHSSMIRGFDQNPEIIKGSMLSGSEFRPTFMDGDLNSRDYTLESLSIYPDSAPPNSVMIESSDEDNITVEFTSRAPSAWKVMEDKERVSSVTVEEVDNEDIGKVEVELTDDTFYFKLSSLGIDDTKDREPEYIMTYDHDREHTLPANIRVEVRDKYNNPVPNAEVSFNAEGVDEEKVNIRNQETETDERGIASTIVTAENVDEDFVINATLEGVQDCKGYTLNNITDVRDVDRAYQYKVHWTDVEDEEINVTQEDGFGPEKIEYYGNNSFDLTASLFEDNEKFSVDFANIDFAVNNSDLATIEPLENTTTDGDANVTITPDDRDQQFSFKVYALSGGTKDVIEVTVIPRYLTMLEPEGGGEVEPEVGNHSYRGGDTVELKADPDPGWEFGEWIINGEHYSNESEIDIVMDKDKEVTAVFEELEMYDLTVSVETVPGAGAPAEVTALWNEESYVIAQGETYTITVVENTEVDLEQTNRDAQLVWAGDYPDNESEETEITLTMDEDKEITAESIN